jgi:hypothetical protein
MGLEAPRRVGAETPGKFHRAKARNKRRGNKNNESLKEWFLIACGDPETSTTWLAGQIQTLEDSGYDVSRQRAGARFDSMKGMPLPHMDEDEEEEESEQEQANPAPAHSSSHSHSKHRSRSSRSSLSRHQSSGRRTPRAEARQREKNPTNPARSSLPFEDPLNIFSPDGEESKDDAVAEAEGTLGLQNVAVEDLDERTVAVNAALSILKRLAPKEEPKNLPEQLDLDLDLVSQVDFSAPMTPSPESHPASPQASPPASPRHDMSTSAPSQLPDISLQPTQSSWTRFLETVQNALADCRADSHWESNPTILQTP